MKRVSESETRLTYEAQNVLPDKDFTLFYTMEGGKFGLSLASFQKKGKDGYFIAMLAPEFADSGTILAKDVAFVFDTSGSMNGKKIEQARGALKFCLNSLKPEDRFSIVSFSTEARAFRKNLVKADKAVIEEAVEFVGNLEARGGTNISEALETALKMKTDDDRPFMVVFMTDGKPTLGIQGESELIDAVKKYNTSGARIFVFGVGFNLNTFILDRFAEDSRGARTYVTPEEDIEIKVSNFFTKVESPVLTDVSVDFENIEIYDMYPRKLPDLFRGTQIEILGRYKGAGERAVILKGKVNGSEKKYVFEEDFSGKTAAGENIPKLWAMRKIYYLLDEIRLHGMKQELKDEVVLLSKEFGIMTPYTSFLVLEDNETVAVNRPQRSADGAIRRLRKEALAPHAIEEAEKADRAVRGGGFSGRDAVTATQELKAAKEKGAAADADDANVFRGKKGGKVIKSVGNKTFYYDGTVWIESTFKDETTRKIVWMSDEYFTFLKDYPDCGKYLSLGKAVVFENGGTWIEIVEK